MMLRIINSLERNDNRFIKYWSQPGYFYDAADPYDDLVYIIYGPRGGGKTTTGIWLNIVDGQWRGIPVISNVPFRWRAYDAKGQQYIVENIPFDINQFARGDQSLKYHRLYIDEGNYELDRLRSTSNKNMAMTDILQQARKLRMSVTFSTINYAWLDPRLTGSLCDITIKCEDLHFKPYGRKHKIGKGVRTTWDIQDQSGKYTGRQYSPLGAMTFYSKIAWGIFDTEYFIDPTQARRSVRYAKNAIVIGQDGEQYDKGEWLSEIKHKVFSMARENPARWKRDEFFDTLGIKDDQERATVSKQFKNWGGELIPAGGRRHDFDLSNLVAVG